MIVNSPFHDPFPNNKVSVSVECFKLVGYNIYYLHTKTKFLFPSTCIICQSTLFHSDHKNIYLFTYVSTHLIQCLFPGYPHPKKGAGNQERPGRDEDEWETLSLVGGDGCGNRSSWHGVKNTVGAQNLATSSSWCSQGRGELGLLEQAFSPNGEERGTSVHRHRGAMYTQQGGCFSQDHWAIALRKALRLKAGPGAWQIWPPLVLEARRQHQLSVLFLTWLFQPQFRRPSDLPCLEFYSLFLAVSLILSLLPT